MANRGYSGGMARATAGAACVLEALGKDTVIVESLGAGQAEKDVFYLCDTTIIVFTPDYGDEIQLLKAGLMEIGDIVIVNKGDLPGTAEAQRELSICASTRIGTDGWTPPVLVTRADKGEGLTQAAKAINDHWSFLGRERRQQKRKEKTRTFVEDLVKEEMWTRFSSAVRGDKECIRITEDAINRKIDPYSAARQIIEKTLLTIKTPTED
jgi:LAO/AO transport system kinase